LVPKVERPIVTPAAAARGDGQIITVYRQQLQADLHHEEQCLQNAYNRNPERYFKVRDIVNVLKRGGAMTERELMRALEYRNKRTYGYFYGIQLLKDLGYISLVTDNGEEERMHLKRPFAAADGDDDSEDDGAVAAAPAAVAAAPGAVAAAPAPKKRKVVKKYVLDGRVLWRNF
jgi:hypothetical protein